jgi:hypothetical protein
MRIIAKEYQLGLGERSYGEQNLDITLSHGNSGFKKSLISHRNDSVSYQRMV